MRATFFGFEAVRKALMANQAAMDITGQNVSNVNTEGYTRQRVDVEAIGVTATSRYAQSVTSTIGQGVNITGVTQIRDSFLDSQYRKESAENGRWEAKLDVMSDIESILDEYETDGLNAKLNELYNQLKSFSENCDSVEYATVFRSAAQKVTEIFNQYASLISDVREEYVYNAQTEIKSVNDTVKKIAELNVLIKGQKAQGLQPNELMDSRNLMLDQLSNIIGAKYEFLDDGTVSIKVGDTYLLDAQKGNKVTEIALDQTGGVLSVITANTGRTVEVSKGSIKGYFESLNGVGTYASASEDGTKGIGYFVKSLDALAQSFADTFNSINDPTGAKKLFVGDSSGTITAANIRISQEWANDAKYINTTSVSDGTTAEGRNDNLLKMLSAMDEKRAITPFFNGTFEEYMTSIIGDLGVEVDYIKDMYEASDANLASVEEMRDAVMGVSLDEETVNLVKYQKAYNAAARVMTAMDEMLDVLINSTGVVGR